MTAPSEHAVSRWVRRAFSLLFVSAAAGVAAIDAGAPFFNDLGWLAVVPAGAAVLARDRLATPAFLAAALAWTVSGMSPGGPVAARVVVIGVDGATFDVIDAHEADLPAFAALEDEGARGVLRSMEPMFSPVLWTTIASGRLPEDHGIVGFHVRSDDCKVARFWDVAEDAGLRIGLYKWLVDYPPREVAGFWVPSWLAAGPETWPPKLSAVKEIELANRQRRKQLEARRGPGEIAWSLVQAGVRLSTLTRAAAWLAEERVVGADEQRRTVAMQLLRGWIDRDVFVAQLHAEQPDLATFTYVGTDGLAHLYWDQPEVVLAAYRQADAIIADVREHLGPDTRLLVVSDHGFRAMDDAGLTSQFAPLTERLRARLTEAAGPVDVTKVGHRLTVGLSGEEQREQVVAAIGTLVDASGDPTYAVEQVSGLSIGLTLVDEAVTAERIATETVGGEPASAYLKLTDAYTGTHDERGVVYLLGAGVQPASDLGERSILDVAPTVLAALGRPASDAMPGRSIVFPEEPRVASWDHLVGRLVWLDGEEGQDEERLRALGYVE